MGVESIVPDTRFASSTGAEFDAALGELNGRRGRQNLKGSALQALVTISKAPSLTVRERDRRVRLLFLKLKAPRDELRELIELLRNSAPDILNAVRGALPAEFRAFAVQVPAATNQPRREAPEPAQRAVVPSETDSQDERGPMFGVALVGTEPEHANNAALLAPAGLKPLRVSTVDGLRELSSSGLCGFAVGPSVWSNLTETEQRSVLKTLCELSTFLFARIALNGLSPTVASELTSLATEARCGPLDGERFCHGSDCALTPADVRALLGSAELLAAAEGGAFFPLGIGEQEARLLRLIAADRQRPSDPVAVWRLGTRELAGGRSGARVYLLQSTTGNPFVVKLHGAEFLADELKRHAKWIAQWEPNLTDPALHLHLGYAAISYRLQPAPDSSAQPAPTLESAIERVRAAEWIDGSNPQAMADDIEMALCRAADRLSVLNRIVPTGGSAQEFWLHWPIRDLNARGVKPILHDDSGVLLDVWALTQTAVKRLQPLEGRGVVHGDIHGRNILLIDRLPAFIDYGASGPGNPLVDLARLDATVRALSLRAILDDRELRRLFTSIYINGATSEAVLAEQVALNGSPAARVAVRTAVKTRACGLDLATHYGCGIEEYLAMVFVVSGYLLAHTATSSAVERALLAALAMVVRT